MDKLRMRFEKTGRAVWISHLDLMATMQRAFSRAGYMLRYSEGFNPHPLISILLPLSVGTGSICELMDFRLREDCDLSELPARLTAKLPEGITVTEAYEAERKSAQLKWLRVEVTPSMVASRWAMKSAMACSDDSSTITKRSKFPLIR